MYCRNVRCWHTAPCASHPPRIRPIGNGSFGQFMIQLVQKELPSSTLLPPYTRHSSLDWKKDVVDSNNEVDGVYVCSPDSEHQAHAIECLVAKKHVLVEKPVTPNFEAVLCAKQPEQVLMVGFHRRFDAEFLRAKEAISKGLVVDSCLLRAADPVPRATQGLSFVLNNSVCHEVDLLSWLWPESNLEWTPLAEDGLLDESVSKIILLGKMNHSDGKATEIRIEYQKEAADYTNVIVLNGREKFGYENFKGVPCCSLYNSAYVAQWRCFTALCSRAVVESTEEEAERLTSYSRSFRWLHNAQNALGFLSNKSSN